MLPQTNARLLPNPEVQFLGSKINPFTSGRWDLRGKKFIRPNTSELVSWGVGIVKSCVDENTVRNFMRVFIQQYQSHGGKVKNILPVIYSSPTMASIADCVTVTRQMAMQQGMIFFCLCLVTH
jgi:eukaryotic translation initiation factor 2C